MILELELTYKLKVTATLTSDRITLNTVTDGVTELVCTQTYDPALELFCLISASIPKGHSSELIAFIGKIHKHFRCKEGVKKHWYCFTFYATYKSDSSILHASTYTGYIKKQITKSIIEENRVNAGVHNNAVLLSCSYLGYMTKEEFTSP